MDKAELALTISAIFISVVSLITSIIFSNKSQQHNVKSVLPIPYFDRSDYENQIHIKIWNKGTGPLIARELKFKIQDGKSGYLIDLIPAPPKNFHYSNFSRFTEKEPRTILPSESNDLIVIEFNTKEKTHLEYRDKVRLFLKDVTIYLDYTDIYGTKFEKYNVDCSWYGRHFE